MFRFMVGAIVGGIAVWLWRDEMVQYMEQRTRDVRSKAADRLRVVQEKTVSVLDNARERISAGFQSGQETVRPPVDHTGTTR